MMIIETVDMNLIYFLPFQNEKTREELKGLVARQEKAEVERLLSNRMLFGTAGLRGRMGTGYAQMNDLVIIQTSQVCVCVCVWERERERERENTWLYILVLLSYSLVNPFSI